MMLDGAIFLYKDVDCPIGLDREIFLPLETTNGEPSAMNAESGRHGL